MKDERLDLTESLMKNADVYNFIRREFLIGFPDLCAFVKRLIGKNAELKDCYKLYCAIRKLEKLLAFIGNYDGEDIGNFELFKRNFVEPVRSVFSELSNFKNMVEDTLDFKKVDSNEFVIRPDFNEELSFLSQELETLNLKFDHQFQLAAKELYLGQNKSIKMEFAASRGFYFKCTLKEEKSLRGLHSYSIFETSKSGVKFTNNEMEQLNQDYLNYTQQYKKLHRDLVQEIVNIASEYSDQFIVLNEISANLDTICSFVNFAFNSPSAVCRPKILPAEEGLIEFKDMKHPLLERFFEGCVIPNDLRLSKKKDEDSNGSYFHVITGPNMGGKSTFIRTASLMVYLSQIGCFVPCSHATVSLVDAILVRIGADDNINRGISTFMAEMLDTSSIIRNSTENSLVVVDELGRGTSTYDGLGLTWSISQHIHDKIKCYCLFATHFHEMTSIATVCPNIANFYSSAIESSEGITMLYRIEPGISKQSYGLNVAKVCGFPKDVIDNAEAFAKEYEYVQCHDMTKLSNNRAHTDELDSCDLENFIQSFKEQTSSTDDIQQKISVLETMIKSSNSIELKNVLNLVQNGP